MVATTRSFKPQPHDFWPRNLSILGSFWPIFQGVFKVVFKTFLGFEILERGLSSRVCSLEVLFHFLGLDFVDLLDLGLYL